MPEESGGYRFTPTIPGEYVVAYSISDAAGGRCERGDPPITVTGAPDAAVAAAPSVAARPAVAGRGPDVRFAAIGDIHVNWDELAEAYDFWRRRTCRPPCSSATSPTVRRRASSPGSSRRWIRRQASAFRRSPRSENHDVSGTLVRPVHAGDGRPEAERRLHRERLPRHHGVAGQRHHRPPTRASPRERAAATTPTPSPGCSRGWQLPRRKTRTSLSWCWCTTRSSAPITSRTSGTAPVSPAAAATASNPCSMTSRRRRLGRSHPHAAEHPDVDLAGPGEPERASGPLRDSPRERAAAGVLRVRVGGRELEPDQPRQRHHAG